MEMTPAAYKFRTRPTRQAEAGADRLPARPGDETGCAYLLHLAGAWYLLNAAAYDLVVAGDEGGYVTGGAEELAGLPGQAGAEPRGERADVEALGARVRSLACELACAA